MRARLALVTVAAIVGCAEPVDDTRRAYVVSVLRLPAPTDGVTAGVDLDGVDSGGGTDSAEAPCDLRHPDYRSEHDGRPGVDAVFNQVVGTVSALLGEGFSVDDELARRIADGELLVAFEVVRGPPARASAFLVEPTAALSLDDAGRPSGGQPFAITQELASGEGDTVEGRSTVRLGDFSSALPLALEGETGERVDLLGVPLRSVQVRFDDADEQLRGELGALMDVEEYIATLPPPMIPEGDMIVRELADVAPRAEEPTRCAYLSVGFAFEAIPARLER